MPSSFTYRDGKPKLALDLPDDEEEVFVPDLLNSTVYIISMALQVSTFAINYRVCVYNYYFTILSHFNF